MARSIPSSVFRSWASITKMLTSNKMPANTLNMPKLRNRSVNDLPCTSAASNRSFFTVSTEAGKPCTAACSSRFTRPEAATPPSTPPRFDTANTALGGAAALALSAGEVRVAERAEAACMRSMVPGATNRLGDVLPPPTKAPPGPSPLNPAIPKRGSSRITRSESCWPYTDAVTVSPTVAPNVLARSVPIAAWSPAGVAPLMPVAPGSPPKARASAKSTSSSRACGSAFGDAPPRNTVAPTVSSDSVPSMPAGFCLATAAATCAPAADPLPATASSTGPSCV